MSQLKRIKNAKYLLDAIDVEDRILEKAVTVAERLITAMSREKRTEANVEVRLKDSEVERIATALAQKIGSVKINSPEENASLKSFSFDDKPKVISSSSLKITGNTIKKTISKDSTKDALEALTNIEI